MPHACLLTRSWPFGLFISLLFSLNTANGQSEGDATPWADWVEPDFPFFSSIIDARKTSSLPSRNNLTPRGIILNLGNDCWACFDTDLLRVSAVWRGPGVTPIALAPKSYHPWGKKTQGGQSVLPEIDGDLILSNGIYPGWQSGERLQLSDPRSPAPSQEEVGRGPLSDSQGRFQAIQLIEDGVVLEYIVRSAIVREQWESSLRSGQPIVERHLEIGPSGQSLSLVAGISNDAGITLTAGDRSRATLSKEQSRWVVRVPASQTATRFALAISLASNPPKNPPRQLTLKPPPLRWPEKVTTRGRLSNADNAYVVDDIDLPHNNPWRRNVRPGDIQFLPDGTGVLPTIDGDIWLASGLDGDLKEIRWKRFASGLHEPMTVAIRDGEIFAFDKNGIWKILDTDGNGEADRHELFSNAFGQTADMREFPSGIRLAPNGEFVIAKGGQQATTLGKHNGSVLRISADGRQATVLGYGLRQPNIGVNVRTGLVTSSDQQGQYIPTTPLHIVRDRQFYGYLSEGLHEREKYPEPIADPLTWIPHSVNASATSQVWLFGARMGALNDSLVHIGFNRAELFQVLLNDRGPQPQASVISITSEMQFPPLHGSINPLDGQLYMAGFQISGWGNNRERLTGLGRVRYTGKTNALPTEISPLENGALLRFDVELDPKLATDPENYSMASWGYKRTYRYGSAQYKSDGKTGIDWITPSSAYLSNDKRSVFVATPDLDETMQLRIGWALASEDGVPVENNAYTTPYSLPPFDPVSEGFGHIDVDLTPRTQSLPEATPISVAEGRRVYNMVGCVACHSIDGSDVAKVGPTWKGLYGKEQTIVVDGENQTITADEAYLRESILDPTAKVVRGFAKGEWAMPSYAGVLSEEQVESLVLFMKSL
ncbi:MAG TPA: hypothetical protein DIV79_02425 [Opitutae bacterium]|nr:hypothetical protein [Opitutaceae bacterium]HCR28859.1 hypothetical protein [Opitutae bacterium]